MQHSESMKAIAPALLAAQKATEFAKKDATNPHFKNKYADLPAVIEAVKPALNAAGIVYIQTASPSDDNRLHLTTMLMHESGEWISDTLVMPLPKQDPQGYGSAMTYARRYALAAITGVYQDDDDGNAASGAGEKKARITKPTAGALESLNEDDQEKALATAIIIQTKFNAEDEWDAFVIWEECPDDVTFKTAVWDKLDSKCRASIKKQSAAAKEQK
ncbi:ERF family protein [Achromobacter xylosoxidans]|uniref:ERF superfamily n=1 Tax=Alcaligenes xylosoxydans xylosoxydans TaxID=85698 RepID=A0A424W5D0_ALCXX|nr:ERF family protein [Achromobacter xylosoxidans]MBC9904797.1 ERF family protein [Achromobacter xylosoxidans]MBD0868714.1 ERF family protein [Achromobacter xylosoxidans]QNP87784.1 ERF family protein [Achromobacter xylosoxidans]RPJ88440.1 hypothetical protein DY367_27935 [Achromobacter xylosoxidans]